MSATHSRGQAKLATLFGMDAHHRLIAAAVVALLYYVAFLDRVNWGKHLVLSWDVFTVCFLLLAWATILTAKPKVAHQTARLQHSTRKWIFLFVLVASCASLAAVFILLSPAKTLSGAMAGQHIALGLMTVVLSWTLIHTIFALQYADLFYCHHQKAKGAALIFPEGTVEPDYYDFAYFSFIIGMTSQVSDVQIGSSDIRRWALLHGLVAFAFNITVLALVINIVADFL